jgi:hypothetical protein
MKIKPVLLPFECPYEHIYTPCIYLPNKNTQNLQRCKSCLVCENVLEMKGLAVDEVNVFELGNNIKECIEKQKKHQVVEKLIEQ